MKKYLLKLTALVLLVGTMVSCSEDKVFYDGTNGPALAQFTGTDGSFGVSPTRVLNSIPVQVSTLSNSDRQITVSIDPIGSTPNIADFIEIVQASSIIPAGSYLGNAVIKYKKTYADISFDQNLTLVLKLDGVQGASVEKSKSLFLVDIYKSCDFNPTAVGTQFTATVEVNASEHVPGAFGPSYSPIITQGTGAKANEFTLDTMWGYDFVDSYFAKGDGTYHNQILAAGKIIVNEDLSLTIVPSTTKPSNGDPAAAKYITGGTGTYDACKNVFVYTLTQTLVGPSNPNTVTVTLTPPAPPVQP